MLHNPIEKKLAATLYKISGLDNYKFKFRFLCIRENLLKDMLFPVRMQKLADLLWRKYLNCPVYPSSLLSFPAFIIPSQDKYNFSNIIEVPGPGDKPLHIELVDEVKELDAFNTSGNERELICRMLERPFSDRLQKLTEEYWRTEWTLFFKQQPENKDNKIDILNAFRGLKFKIVIIEEKGIYLSADIRTKYISRKSLKEYSEDEMRDILKDHLLLKKIEKRHTLLRDNGNVKIPCQFIQFTDKAVSDFTFSINEKEQTIFNYYKQRYPNIRLNPLEKTVLVCDRGRQDNIRGVPISRLFPVFKSDFDGFRKCSIRPSLTPEERKQCIEYFLKDFNDIPYGENKLSVEKTFSITERTVFIPPRLVFGNNYIVSAFETTQDLNNPSRFDTNISRWSSMKMPALYSAGPYLDLALPDIVFIYPKTLQRQSRESFCEKILNELSKQTHKKISIIRKIPYETGGWEKTGNSLCNIANVIKVEYPNTLALVVLWQGFNDGVYGRLKKTISPLLSQCVSEKTLNKIVYDYTGANANSCLRNLALGILIEAGIKPWVIEDPLNHDIHIGIDLLYGTFGYHVIYGPGGRLIERYYGQNAKRGRMYEALRTNILRQQLYNTISTIVGRGYIPQSILIHRDGRWWPSESIAMHQAIERLKQEKKVPGDISCAAVEIRKHHMPIRLFTYNCKYEYDKLVECGLQNPLPGTYLRLDRNRVILTSTGKPGSWDRSGRTAGTILIELVDEIGEFDIIKIAEDVFRLTQLNWSSPDIEIGLPVTIRWADQLLREIYSVDVEEDDDESIIYEWDE